MRHIAVAAGVAISVLVLAVPAAGSGCGGLLQPSCPPPPPVSAPDPGGDVNAAIPVPPADGKLFGFNTNLWWQTSGGNDLGSHDARKP